MDISSSTDTVSELNRIKQQAKQEKCSNEEKLAKLKAEHEQALKNKNCEITSEIERIKQKHGRTNAQRARTNSQG